MLRVKLKLDLKVFKVVEPLFRRVGLRVELLGNKDIWEETRMLDTAARSNYDARIITGLSEIHMLVATPGILEIHLKETKSLTLKHLRFLVRIARPLFSELFEILHLMGSGKPKYGTL